ncbi:hypothetical protein WN51_09259 [Melipona quadrifasciata]|uniref:Uncharacterized protein n=1 Tax=Melipona quadrifasciata TaxID=166423 RepID=A0A0M9A5E7_9HYME|nr:hypothetical protein WN51_09259 [Melipona quadrifasciata]
MDRTIHRQELVRIVRGERMSQIIDSWQRESSNPQDYGGFSYEKKFSMFLKTFGTFDNFLENKNIFDRNKLSSFTVKIENKMSSDFLTITL